MRVFIVAGEASGDRLGGALMEGLGQVAGPVSYAGVGGRAMQAQGLESLFPMQELSVMGLAEILPRYRQLKRRIAETAEAALAFEPDVIVTIDSPDFSFRVAGLVKARRDIPVAHYVAPQVWAWRPHRAQKMARVVDHVLALLPFEPPYMQAAGMSCDFVGHPVATEPQASPAEIAAFREAHGLGAAPLVLALPGSRKSEIARLSPVFGAALAQVAARRPGLRVALPVAQNMEEAVAAAVADWPVSPILIGPAETEARRAAFGAADAALAASGTVALDLAAADTPMVIAYDVAWLTRQILKRMILSDAICMVNLVSESRAVPEFVGERCRADLIAPALAAVLEAPDAQRAAMARTMELLGRGGEAPGLRAARSVLGFLGRGSGNGSGRGDPALANAPVGAKAPAKEQP